MLRNPRIQICAVALIAWLPAACSTYHSHYYQEPQENGAGWSVRTGESPFAIGSQYYADYQGDGVKISATVPLSGSRQHFAGPCLLPVLPIRQDRPQSLAVHIAIETDAGRSLSARPGLWNALTQGENPVDSFAADDLKTARPYRVSLLDESGASLAERSEFPGEAWRARWRGGAELRIVYFDAYDLDFYRFTLSNMTLTVDGNDLRLPPLVFERESRGSYTPFTTKILDVLE
ncbi:MAG: hypothetical protein NXI24_22780 [bacterium]|nr:hypothetical protein [bacterium]